jgi:hypothetical protein
MNKCHLNTELSSHEGTRSEFNRSRASYSNLGLRSKSTTPGSSSSLLNIKTLPSGKASPEPVLPWPHGSAVLLAVNAPVITAPSPSNSIAGSLRCRKRAAKTSIGSIGGGPGRTLSIRASLNTPSNRPSTARGPKLLSRTSSTAVKLILPRYVLWLSSGNASCSSAGAIVSRIMKLLTSKVSNNEAHTSPANSTRNCPKPHENPTNNFYPNP